MIEFLPKDIEDGLAKARLKAASKRPAFACNRGRI